MAKVNIFLFVLLVFTANCGNSARSTDEDRARPPVQGQLDQGNGGHVGSPTGNPRAGATDRGSSTAAGAGRSPGPQPTVAPAAAPRPAAYDVEAVLRAIAGRRVGLVVNHTSTVDLRGTHLVDTLRARGARLTTIFAPEHGFRGTADAGASVASGVDLATGLPVRSLYGKRKKPSAGDLQNIDLLVFDIQDVGARFYTYISTLFYVMEAAAEQDLPVLVLDRPNPNGHRIAGPVLDPAFQSFVGIAPIPVLHGLTVGEFARMVNGEGWLAGGVAAELEVLRAANYTHATPYELPIPPSPNLPNMRSVYLYPTLCFFEGTAVSVGRGTNRQFQRYGHPDLGFGDIRFTPVPGPGSASPKLKGQLCRGVDLSGLAPARARSLPALQIDRLLRVHQNLEEQNVKFFTRPDFFDLLAGTDQLRIAIEAGRSAAAIEAGWAAELAAYRRTRAGYLLYPD